MDELDMLLQKSKERDRSFIFDPKEWACTKEELQASDRERGEKQATSFIAFARKHYKSPRSQAKELRWWCQYASVFYRSAEYALLLLIAEIRKLENV